MLWLLKPMYTLSECVHLQCCKEVDSGVLIQGEVGPSEVHVHHGKQVLQREKTYEQVMGSASHVRRYVRLRTSTHAHASHANSGPTLSAILAQLSIHRKSWTRSSSAKRTSSYKAQAKDLRTAAHSQSPTPDPRPQATHTDSPKRRKNADKYEPTCLSMGSPPLVPRVWGTSDC